MHRPIISRCLQLILLFTLVFTGILRAEENFQKEYIVITGGPSLIEWEKFKKVPHDHWWANFAHASRIRLDELRQQFGPEARITWLVYKPS